MAPRRPRYSLFHLVMVVLLCGLVFASARWAWRLATVFRALPPPGEDDRTAFGLTSFVLLEVGFVGWFLAWGVVRARRNAPGCVECGRKVVAPRKSAGPATCPRCRRRALPPAAIAKQQSRDTRTGLAFLAILASGLGVGLSMPVAARLGLSSWAAFVPLATVATLGLAAAFLVPVIVLALIRNRLMASDDHALARARKLAGEDGEESDAGPIRGWHSGPVDPAPLLRAQWEAVRDRFATLFGEPAEDRGPFRVFCFHRRDALVEFHRQAATDLWNYDGVYTPAPARRLTLSTEVIPHRASDTGATARSLFALALLDRHEGFRPAPWLQLGITQALTFGDDGLDRLDRKVLAAMARGATLGEELFRLRPAAIARSIRRGPSHDDHVRLARVAAQSWSLVAYLSGGDAPEGRRARFRACLAAIRRGEPDESAFRDRFPDGFAGLLEGWRGWVSGRGVGAHAPPSPRAREVVAGRLVPTALDRRAKVLDRILAVRGIGAEGHALGAGALIDLLRDPGEVPREELAWSLEMISGMAWGDDVARWASWWGALPPDVRGEAGGPVPPL